ncbi:YwiC-like family protein [Pyxidicoccus parkwayensis]|uniref:YwiC-like family protein n=1 Tax=Pyxidicoccus parkwayensis TaxID=2813578 RepID=A0ABX7NTE2_9BACT|nr:YwiC-like family protein [Pyxidicoccus parkwaysis]QSQ22055.1 YwiC-like family protein [Pyxidicoccus parkwaysis]
MVTLPARQPLSLSRQALLPREHGAYFQLGLPLATVLSLTGPNASALWLTLAAVSCFLLHEPVLVLLGHRGARRHEEERLVARSRTAFFAALGAASLVLALRGLDAAARPYLALPGILGGEVLLMAWGRQERTLSGEVLASLALGAWAVPVGVAGGLVPDAALSVWGTFALGFALATVVVHVIIRSHKPRGNRALPRLAVLVAGGLGIAGALVWALSTGVSAWRAVALLPAPLVALGTLVLRMGPRHLKQMGWSFAAAGLVTAVLLGVGLA